MNGKEDEMDDIISSSNTKQIGEVLLKHAIHELGEVHERWGGLPRRWKLGMKMWWEGRHYD
jgi:hypothetical protein